MPITPDSLLNDFAIRSFRDIGDADYIAARMASRAALVTQYLWASQQMIEKYFKCILLLNRIPARKVKHNLGLAISKIQTSGKLTLDFKGGTWKFIEFLDTYGKFRYMEVSSVGFGGHILPLDRAAWELRRYCTLSPLQVMLQEGFPAPKVRLPGGYLEKVIDNPQNPARKPLLWQNAFFGGRVRKTVRLPRWFKASNSPLYLHPEILDEVLKYVYLPDNVQAAYRALPKP